MVLADLADARERRQAARAAEREAMADIARALKLGRALDLEIAVMARTAGIDRQTAYNLLSKKP